MKSNDELKEIDIKNRTADDIIRIENFDPDNMLLDEKYFSIQHFVRKSINSFN